MKNNKKREGGHRNRTTKMDAPVPPAHPWLVRPPQGVKVGTFWALMMVVGNRCLTTRLKKKNKKEG